MTPQDVFAVEFPNAGRVNAHTYANAPLAAVFDDLGRIVVVDLERSKVLFRNDGK